MAPPPPPPPFVYLSTTGASTLLRRAAFYGNLGLLLFSDASIPPDRCATKRLGIEKGKARDAILALNKVGIGLLHAAACQGHLNVCKFLVEEFGGDMNIAGAGLTPFMAAAEPDNVPTVEYFLDHGGDVTKTDDKGCTVLHHAAGTGCCKVTEFLLTKGLPVSIDCDLGTPLFHAANNGKDKTLKILLDHQADLGWLPVEHVALHDFREEVEMLFPLTSPIQNVPEWNINGIISCKIQRYKANGYGVQG
ncbi:uncharacterized protein LOC127754070 [Oryza glaberrima]|uniref:uncharacterized protein LOC127754070 n=1 Tax=Oryza glaberrima TaxID=4538 RepID=UPI00224C4123|nr:uncharacterized protein LOC127754070 [Oryza glaberrima]